jgi:hypothetical protein
VIVDFSAMFDMNYAATYLGLIDAVAAYEVSRLSTADDYRRQLPPRANDDEWTATVR